MWYPILEVPWKLQFLTAYKYFFMIQNDLFPEISSYTLLKNYKMGKGDIFIFFICNYYFLQVLKELQIFGSAVGRDWLKECCWVLGLFFSSLRFYEGSVVSFLATYQLHFVYSLHNAPNLQEQLSVA